MRYPVRLIFLNTFHALRDLVSHLARNIRFIQLKESLRVIEHEDGWFTSEDLYRIITSQKTDSLIVPLSELLRFFSDGELQSLLFSVFEIENAPEHASRRIYLPFVGLKGRCENNVFKTFHRRGHWVLNQPYLQTGYLYKTMSAIVRYTDDELITHLWFDIFEFTPSNAEIFTERKTYLKLLHEEYKLPCHPLEEKLRRKLSELVEKPLELQAQYLTNISYAERTYLLDLLQTMGADQQERSDALLRQVYPELFHYLHWQAALANPTLEDWLPAYFQEYVKSKVFDCKTDTLTALLNEKNHDQDSFYAWYYHLGKPQEHDGNSCLIWIDGLGAEWLPLLIYLINSYGQTKNKHIAKPI